MTIIIIITETVSGWFTTRSFFRRPTYHKIDRGKSFLGHRESVDVDEMESDDVNMESILMKFRSSERFHYNEAYKNHFEIKKRYEVTVKSPPSKKKRNRV